MKKETFPVDILVDTGADGGSYMSLAFYHMIDKWGRLVTSIPPRASPPSIRVLGSIILQLKSPWETRVRKIAFRVVDGLPYGLIVGAGYLKKRRKGIVDFRPETRALNTARTHLRCPF